VTPTTTPTTPTTVSHPPTQDRSTAPSTRAQDRRRGTAQRAVEAAGAAAGQAVGVLFGVAARVRGDRPLHPRGTTYAARVTVTGGGGTGVPWLDEPATHDATFRASRSAGLPPWLPDVHGVALRLRHGTRHPVDLLFASAGASTVGRFILHPGFRMANALLTTLWPVRSPAGPLLLGLEADPATPRGDTAPQRFVLSWASGRGAWHEAGHVTLVRQLPPDVDAERYDAVVHQLPGTDQYGVVSRFREPAYRAARAVRPRRTQQPPAGSGVRG